jgi:predicted DNA-binding protein
MTKDLNDDKLEVRLPTELKARLQAAADAEGERPSAIVRALIVRWLSRRREHARRREGE